MKNHTIIGMAGHIDHGKTALIKALTGIETDRLPEERLRNITIDIGFAYWQDNVTIIDVPGHEKFIRNMVAGVHTVDLFLLVIAADDGIMPQTLEHLEILNFFGVKQGVIAINKIDLADEEWLEMVTEETAEVLEKYGFREIPIIPVSAVTGANVDRLKEVLQQKLEQLTDVAAHRPFRLNVDRVFSSHGHGTVVTGTVLSGNIESEQRVEVIPPGKTVKVRGVQVHRQTAGGARQGQRAAINLGGLDVTEVQRGSVLLEPGSLDLSDKILIRLHTAHELPFIPKKHSEVSIHLGAARHRAKISWFGDHSRWQPGTDYLAILKFSQPLVAAPGDPLLVRSLSPVYTLAGGRVLLNDPPARLTGEDLEDIDTLDSGTLEEKLPIWFRLQKNRAFSFDTIRRKLFLDAGMLQDALQKLARRKSLLEVEQNTESWYLLPKTLDRVTTELPGLIKKNLKNENAGISIGELTRKLAPVKMDEVFLRCALGRAVNKGLLFDRDGLYSLHDPAKDGAEDRLRETLLKLYSEARFAAPDLKEVAASLQEELDSIRRLTSGLAKAGRLVSIDGKYYLHQDVFDALLNFLSGHFKEAPDLSVAQVREFTGVSRKYLIPLMEYLDRLGYTLRDGDVRKKGQALPG